MTIVKKIDGEWKQLSGVIEIESEKLDINKVEQLISVGIWTEKDYSKYSIIVAVPVSLPDGKQRIGQPLFQERDGKVFEEYDTIDIIEPGPETIDEKLIRLNFPRTDLELLISEVNLTELDKIYAELLILKEDVENLKQR